MTALFMFMVSISQVWLAADGLSSGNGFQVAWGLWWGLCCLYFAGRALQEGV
jgi:hypothetical protein